MTEPLKWIDTPDYSAVFFAAFGLYVTKNETGYEIELCATDTGATLYTQDNTDTELQPVKHTAIVGAMKYFDEIQKGLFMLKGCK